MKSPTMRETLVPRRAASMRAHSSTLSSTVMVRFFTGRKSTRNSCSTDFVSILDTLAPAFRQQKAPPLSVTAPSPNRKRVSTSNAFRPHAHEVDTRFLLGQEAVPENAGPFCFLNHRAKSPATLADRAFAPHPPNV